MMMGIKKPIAYRALKSTIISIRLCMYTSLDPLRSKSASVMNPNLIFRRRQNVCFGKKCKQLLICVSYKDYFLCASTIPKLLIAVFV